VLRWWDGGEKERLAFGVGGYSWLMDVGVDVGWRDGLTNDVSKSERRGVAMLIPTRAGGEARELTVEGQARDEISNSACMKLAAGVGSEMRSIPSISKAC
jgi:hypothetical protein